jgi:thiamine-phosphate pyrophosphorylase
MSPLSRDDLRLYLVTDEKPRLLPRVEASLRGGVTCVQLRLKEARSDVFLQTAWRLKQICRRYQVPLMINDRADVARQVRADALHIGQEDLAFAKARQEVGPDMPIGVSVHTVAEAKQAERDGAAYLGVGAMFPTPSKGDAKLVSFETLSAIRDAVRIPLVLIGGINADTLPELLPYQPDGVAIISAILSADDPEQRARALRKQLEH